MRITDILEAITAIESCAAGMTVESFREDRRTVDAVIRNFGIIGKGSINPRNLTVL